MATIIKFILATWLCLVFGSELLFAAETRHTPITFASGSGMTIQSGVTVTFDAGSTLVLNGGLAVPFSSLTSKPTTLAGYGIIDAQPLDLDLTAISALTGTNTIYYRSADGVWTAVVIGTGLSFSGGSLTATGGGGGGNVSDTIFSSGWNGVTTDAPSKNAVYDYFHIGDTDDDGKANVLDMGAGIVKTTSGGVLGAVTIGTGLSFDGTTLTATGGSANINDTVFGSGWNGNTTDGASKNALYDYFHTYDTDDDGKVNVLDVGAGLTKTDAGGVTGVVTIGAGLSFDGTTLLNTGPTAITATGDVTGTYSGTTIPLVIGAAKVTNAMLASVPTATFKGRAGAGTGPATDMTVATAKTLLGLTGTNSGDQTITLTGEITGVGTGSFATTLGNTAITNRTEDTDPDLNADFVLSSDTSATALKKVKMSSIVSKIALDTIKDPIDPTKQLAILVSGFPTLTTRNLTPANGNSVTIIPSSASAMQGADGVDSGGNVTYSNFIGRPGSVVQTAKTASITTTNYLGSAPPAGLYRVIYYVLATTAGTSGTLDITVAWNDGSAARTDVNTAAITFGSLTFATKTIIMRANGSNHITYAVADNSPVGSPVYAFYSTLERLQ